MKNFLFRHLFVKKFDTTFIPNEKSYDNLYYIIIMIENCGKIIWYNKFRVKFIKKSESTADWTRIEKFTDSNANHYTTLAYF